MFGFFQRLTRKGFGRTDVLSLLLGAGATLSARDDGGLVPLHNAASFGHADVARLLLEPRGADADARDNWAYTPLHEAASKGKVDVCVVLLQHGADPTAKNTDGRTPIDIADSTAKAVLTGEYRKDELLEASRSGNEELLLSLLTPLNVNCHASDGRKSTPLHLVVMSVDECLWDECQFDDDPELAAMQAALDAASEKEVLECTELDFNDLDEETDPTY